VSDDRAGRVVLFRSSGFAGCHLAPRLAAEGWTVQVASRHPRQEEAYAAAVRVVTVAADLGAEDQVRRAVIGAEAVINLVGIAREQDASFEAVHVAGAARVAQLAAAAGVKRLLHVSALGLAEDAPAAADRTKAAGEAAVRAAFPAVTLVRPSLIHGPGDHFFSRFAAMAKASPVLPVIGGGRTRFQPRVYDAGRWERALADNQATTSLALRSGGNTG
jgi:NADH dehydrogenase